MATGGHTPTVIFAAKEEFMIRIIRDMLRACDIKGVGTYTEIREAVAEIRAHANKWDIFLIDGALPNAIAAIKGIRQELGPHIKILLLMSSPTKEDVVEAHDAGINDFVVLPCSQIDFGNKINKLVGKEIVRLPKSKTAVVYRKS